jgi:hypothetical protein
MGEQYITAFTRVQIFIHFPSCKMNLSSSLFAGPKGKVTDYTLESSEKNEW